MNSSYIYLLDHNFKNLVLYIYRECYIFIAFITLFNGSSKVYLKKYYLNNIFKNQSFIIVGVRALMHFLELYDILACKANILTDRATCIIKLLH